MPPGGFLQAVEVAELAMADLVTGHLKKAKKVADLFAGIGTFALGWHATRWFTRSRARPKRWARSTGLSAMPRA